MRVDIPVGLQLFSHAAINLRGLYWWPCHRGGGGFTPAGADNSGRQETMAATYTDKQDQIIILDRRSVNARILWVQETSSPLRLSLADSAQNRADVAQRS